ncbi:MAG: FecR domain-containing protein [Nitrospinales bacterium]
MPFLSKSVLFAFIFFLMQVSWTYAQETATLENVRGNVRVVKPGDVPAGRAGEDGMALSSNDRVITAGAGAMADIRFKDGSVIRVMPNSELTLEQADFINKNIQIAVSLTSGKIFNVVNPLQGDSHYIVRTSNGVAEVKGTVFSAETAEQRSVFMVKEGKVEATHPEVSAQAVLVDDLNKTIVAPQAAPSAPIPLTPEEIAMFDILDDISADIKEDLREEIQEEIQEELLNNALERE